MARARTAHRRRYFHGGAIAMITIATVVAVVAAFVATYVYAQVDANRKPPSEEQTGAALPPPTTASPDQPSTTKAPEILTQEDVAKKVATSVRGVRTRDEAGQEVSGTAFVVGSFGGQTLLLTSYTVVRAATKAPGPEIALDGGGRATLWTWQEDRDLALLTVGGSAESLPWATVLPQAGEKIYAGAAGQKLAPGVVLTASDTAIEHNVFIDDVRQGAPLVNVRGEVLGMASKFYNPGGRGTDTLFIAIPIRIACDRMLKCGSGNTTPTEAGTSASSTTTSRP